MSHLLREKTPWRRELYLVHQCPLAGALAFAPHVHGGAVVLRFGQGDALCIGKPLAHECALIRRETAKSQSDVFTVTEHPWSADDLRGWFIKLRDGVESLTAEEIDIAYHLECDAFIDMALDLELKPSF
jgi:hypothetical protein